MDELDTVEQYIGLAVMVTDSNWVKSAGQLYTAWGTAHPLRSPRFAWQVGDPARKRRSLGKPAWDRLGSMTVAANSNGVKSAEQLYTAWGTASPHTLQEQ